MIETEYSLRSPSTDEEWLAFHTIRRKVLFVNRGKNDYTENHPDDFKTGNHPLILIYRGDVIGVVRIDVSEGEAWLRRVAIRDDLQRLGHGRVLIHLAEVFAMHEGCNEMRSNAATEAVGFYERCGYVCDTSTRSPQNSVTMCKSVP